MLDALKRRRTYKIIGDADAAAPPPEQDREGIRALLAAAGNAPFHYACDRIHTEEMTSPVPWRAHVLDALQCRTLMQRLVEDGDVTKIPAMLAAADYLLQVTWLPDPVAEGSPQEEIFTGSLRNMEHIAAASAFVQSLLLAGEEAGYRTYWSSGGGLRKPPVFELLSIPPGQVLLGAVFLFPGKLDGAEVKPGSMAEKRGPVESWARFVKI